MYIVATLHVVLGIYRVIQAYIVVENPKGPISYLYDVTLWSFRANNVLLCVMTWLGDALVIYRCYYVWSGNFWVILLPTVLLFATVGVDAFILYWWDHQLAFSATFNILPWLNSIYPLAFAQNVFTTGLIGYKIWKQHRKSVSVGIVDRGSRLGLLHILRIIIESAAVYTIQLCLLIILYALQNNFQVILQDAIVPSIGIVFVLIAVRVHNAKNRPIVMHPSLSMRTIPAWLGKDELTDVEMQDSGLSTASSGPRLDLDDNHFSSASSRPSSNRLSMLPDMEKQ
ncbi:hypothetical protein CPB83DRAFT_848898 [Crepidotus variabilis]|uniref:Uncharacterized protein n=1 Tax=Crepidotus variabilis TaxID=179855 RepID=A0A9P6EMK2_9AGAR|nr:hypothetical protein CPB83DRAFT_848898 [Crepidotus variabilis]